MKKMITMTMMIITMMKTKPMMMRRKDERELVVVLPEYFSIVRLGVPMFSDRSSLIF